MSPVRELEESRRTVQLELKDVELFEMVKSVVKLLKVGAETKGIDLTLSGEGVSVRGDKEGLTEVFTNLIENFIE